NSSNLPTLRWSTESARARRFETARCRRPGAWEPAESAALWNFVSHLCVESTKVRLKKVPNRDSCLTHISQQLLSTRQTIAALSGIIVAGALSYGVYTVLNTVSHRTKVQIAIT